MLMHRFEGKTVLITGGARGIGRALCLEFAREGARVAFCFEKRQAQADALQEELASLGCENLAFKCQVENYQEVAQMIRKVQERFQSLDILVNNAGKLSVGAFAGMRAGDWQAMIDTNLHGLFNCSKLALPYLLKSKGQIINVSSFMAFKPAGPGQAVYAATKAGIIGFSRSLSNELASMGIRVNVIAPGLIDTEMIQTVDDKILKQILAKTGMKRLGTPREIAGAILFLASDDGAYISGQTLVADGGAVHSQF
jgi:3-oxoacyl-[acyl-carrier protein] reductase